MMRVYITNIVVLLMAISYADYSDHIYVTSAKNN